MRPRTKIILTALLLGLLATGDLYADEANKLVGEWKANGKKTVEARIENGSLKNESIADKLIPIYSDEIYIFTDQTIKIKFISENSTSNPLPYEIVEQTDSSITISYHVKNGEYDQLTFHFSGDENCIHVKREKYNDYFCKNI